MPPDEGVEKSPPDKGGQGGCSLDKGFFNNPDEEGIVPHPDEKPTTANTE